MRSFHELYRDRFLSQGYPDLEQLAVRHKGTYEDVSMAKEVLDCIGRLVNLSEGSRSVVDVGCGPNVANVKALLEAGFDAYGVEPVAGYLEVARRALNDPARILKGTAERLPFPDGSQRVVLMQAVLEHVSSPQQCVTEAYRVLAPDGVLYLSTVFKHRLSITGWNPEYRKRFFNWYPAVLKECYVHHHLHFDPRLANYSVRPAVHWFTFPELCRLGRNAGFAAFYTKMDLANADSVYLQRSRWRRLLVNAVKHRPWLRALVLTQIGHIIMWKRPDNP
jgi:ubiquinone/menaquinone biosynthesis C-methylase UbiE